MKRMRRYHFTFKLSAGLTLAPWLAHVVPDYQVCVMGCERHHAHAPARLGSANQLAALGGGI